MGTPFLKNHKIRFYLKFSRPLRYLMMCVILLFCVCKAFKINNKKLRLSLHWFPVRQYCEVVQAVVEPHVHSAAFTVSSSIAQAAKIILR